VVVKTAFGEFGSAGGHRSMARAVMSLANLKELSDGSPSDRTYRDLESRFLSALKSE
jgi:hypothetical protein